MLTIEEWEQAQCPHVDVPEVTVPGATLMICADCGLSLWRCSKTVTGTEIKTTYVD